MIAGKKTHIVVGLQAFFVFCFFFFFTSTLPGQCCSNCSLNGGVVGWRGGEREFTVEFMEMHERGLC